MLTSTISTPHLPVDEATYPQHQSLRIMVKQHLFICQRWNANTNLHLRAMRLRNSCHLPRRVISDALSALLSCAMYLGALSALSSCSLALLISLAISSTEAACLPEPIKKSTIAEPTTPTSSHAPSKQPEQTHRASKPPPAGEDSPHAHSTLPLSQSNSTFPVTPNQRSSTPKTCWNKPT